MDEGFIRGRLQAALADITRAAHLEEKRKAEQSGGEAEAKHPNRVGRIPTQRYRVTANSFLADGGSQLYEFTKGTNRVAGEIDLDALMAYFMKNPSLSPQRLDRIKMGGPTKAQANTSTTNAASISAE